MPRAFMSYLFTIKAKAFLPFPLVFSVTLVFSASPLRFLRHAQRDDSYTNVQTTPPQRFALCQTFIRHAPPRLRSAQLLLKQSFKTRTKRILIIEDLVVYRKKVANMRINLYRSCMALLQLVPFITNPSLKD